VLPKAGIDTTPDGVCRFVAEITTVAGARAVNDHTATNVAQIA
jgi:hypothetical protein